MVDSSSPINGRIDASFRASLDKDVKEMEEMAKKAEQGSLSEGEMIRYNSVLTRWSTKVGLLAKITSSIDETLKNIVNR
jgi:hypothetical protein